MRSVLANLRLSPCGLIQFWVPVISNGRQLLTTSGQPFGVPCLSTEFSEHRTYCQKYLYDVDVVSMKKAQQVDEDHILSINGPPATAFLSHLPQFIYDLKPCFKNKHSHPLLASASEHGFDSCIVLPIFDPHTKCCLGVLECCMWSLVDLEKALDILIAAIKGAFLITFDAREFQPCESIDGLPCASDEIKVALKTIYESHNLHLAQAWIRYVDKIHGSFSSIMEHNCNDYDLTHNRGELALKLLHYHHCNKAHRPWNWINFYKGCNIHPLRMGEGLVGKTLQSHEPYLCKDISAVDRNEPSLSHTAGIKGSCFAICLRSTYTHNLDYVLEFFWTHGQNVKILLESILLTLKRTLPSFKVVNGKEIVDELCVKEIKYSSKAKKCVVEDIVILQQPNKISNRQHNISRTSLNQEVIEQLFGKTQIEVAENIDGVPSDVVFTGEEIARNELCIEEIAISSKASECMVEDDVTSEQESDTSKRKYKTSLISLNREIIERQFGKIQSEAAKELNVSLSTLKRKCKDVGIKEWQGQPKSGKMKVSNSQGEPNGTNGDDIQTIQGPLVINKDPIPNDTVLIIKAKYGDDLIKFSVPLSTTMLQAVEEEISKSFALNLQNYKLKYYDEDKDLVTITCDKHFDDCIKTSRSLNSTAIRLQVVPNV